MFCLTDNEEVVGLAQVSVSDLNVLSLGRYFLFSFFLILTLELNSVDHLLVIGVDEPEEVL